MTPPQRRPTPIFDAHLHVVDPRFSLMPNRGYLPDPFTVEDYRAAVAPLDVRGGAVVSASFQGADQTYLRDALARLGPSFVGVTHLAPDVPDHELVSLDAAGVRAVRVNLRRRGPVGAGALEALASRVDDVVGWHVELYADAADLDGLLPTLVGLPRVVVDHLGLSADGLATLVELVRAGASVKASGFGRVDLDVRRALETIAAVNPAALVFGTDLPSTRAPRPFEAADLDLVVDVLGEELAREVCWDNAVALYRPGCG